MKMRMKVALGAVIAVIATGAVGTSAMATDPKSPPTRTDAVTGTLDGPARAQQNGIELEVRRDTQVADFELTYSPGSDSGWHKHPGIVIAVVKSGAVWRQIGCTATKFSKGESFTEVKPHYVSNVYTSSEQDGAENAVLEITQLYPKGTDTTKLRVDQPAPSCPYGIHYVD